MTQSQKKTAVFSTPIGTLIFSRVQKPDTKFNPDGEYVARFKISEADAKPLIDQLQRVYDEALVEAKKEAKGKKVKENDFFAPVIDRDTDEPIPGMIEFKFKRPVHIVTKKGETVKLRPPAVVDAKGAPIPDDVNVRAGSKVRAAFSVRPYYKAALGFGLSLRLEGVRVIELAEGGYDINSVFGDEDDGYSVADATVVESGAHPSTDEGDDGDPDVDF